MPDFQPGFEVAFCFGSILPFVFGSLAAGDDIKLIPFLLGCIAVLAMHLGANLMNDYSDSKSGVDWKDRKFYGYFGGSKLIQESVLSESFYLKSSILLFVLAFLSVTALSFLIREWSAILFLIIILFLGFSYSHKPFQFSYHYLGELIIFLLFGPALVMGGYFIQTGVFPDVKSFLLSLPFGFFTTAILFSNEVPDCSSDSSCGKKTWVVAVGPEKSFILYILLEACAFFSIIVNIYRGYLGVISVFSFLLLWPLIRAALMIKYNYSNKDLLITSSKITIGIQALASLILIVDKVLL
ncbi:MAG: hypothetical protein GF375_01745 [Candidatus Omnitrophica bacterium]|nr:hypothetical protein [Candidatus Omnitrophota bacterium]MBD3268847.1 hypothetical protein [Candidatus Omnitrophota bacterium]